MEGKPTRRRAADWSGREGSTWKEVVYDLYILMDPVLGRLRERVGEDVELMVMSDHGFAPETSADEGFPRFVSWFKAYHGID